MDDESTPSEETAPEPNAYAAVGERVAGILEAAEQAGEQIRQEARHEAAEEMVRQVEGDVRRRQEQLRAEVRMLEQRKRDSIERLEEIAALVQDVLPSRSDDSLVGDLKPERPART